MRKEERDIKDVHRDLVELKSALEWLFADDGGRLRDTTEDMTIAEVASLQKTLKEITDDAGEIKTELQKTYDFIRYVRVPAIMEREDVESVKIEGVGRMYLLSDYNMSIKKGQKEPAIEWLIENGLGDIVQETVNASTLKAALKGVIKNGVEIPEDMFNISPFTRAQITK